MRPLPALPLALALGFGLGLAFAPGPGAAQIVLFERDDLALQLSGYVRSLTAVHDRGHDLGFGDRRTGLNGEVLRVQWQLRGATWTFDVHDRVQARLSTAAGADPGVGLGVSAVPGRSVDLAIDLVDQPGLRVWHDIDRLSVTFRAGPLDLTAGRQPITWGVSSIFTVADLWTTFSPFELDTTEKPGVDAVRALFYPAPRVEVDAVVADRGRLEDLSAGARATLGLAHVDLWVGGGKLWRQLMAMGGVTLLRDETRWRAEAVLPWDLDGDALGRPRATLGVDWIRSRFVLTGELHYNGIGAREPDGYVQALQDPRVRRGETYYVGRHYLGALAGWTPDDDGRISLGLSALANVRDPSLALIPVLSYDIGAAASISAGALISAGATPVLTPTPGLRSEFGAYGDLLFTRISLYF